MEICGDQAIDLNKITKAQLAEIIEVLDPKTMAADAPKQSSTTKQTSIYSKKVKDEFEPILRVLGIAPTGTQNFVTILHVYRKLVCRFESNEQA